jgi:uncharacterized membrane protein (GlpM family)
MGNASPGTPGNVHEVLILAVKGLAGGALVLVFALISECLTPKRFAGLFGAAPAVALAGLIIAVFDKGRHDAHQSSVGMLAGAAGMMAYAALAVPLLRRVQASRAAAVALSAWLATAAVFAVPVMLG